MSLAGYQHDVYLGTVSMFYVLLLLQSFFGNGNYAIVFPYMAELWPAPLRASGFGLVYGASNLGKFIGPAGLAVIAGGVQLCLPTGNGRCDRSGLQLLRGLVCPRHSCLPVRRHRNPRPHDRRARCGARPTRAGQGCGAIANCG